MIELPLVNSPFKTIIDEDDYDVVSKFSWRINTQGYVCCVNLGKYMLMHRLILNILEDDKLIADHENHNKLDNRKNNIRICTKLENNKNIKKYTNKEYTSKYKGVYWQKDTSRWRAQIHYDGKRKSLGYYSIEEHAAIAYNSAAIELHGEFACLNVLPDEFKNCVPEVSYFNKNNIRTSKYVGVSFNKVTKRWHVGLQYNKCKIFIGAFNSEEDAGKIYDQFSDHLGYGLVNFKELHNIVSEEYIVKRIEKYSNRVVSNEP